MSNVINYSKPSATVFKRSIKGSVHMKHTSHWPTEEHRELGNAGLGGPDLGPTEWGGQVPRHRGPIQPHSKGEDIRGSWIQILANHQCHNLGQITSPSLTVRLNGKTLQLKGLS